MTETSIPQTTHTVVGSSNISELAWKDDTLYIKFHKSGWYSYVGVALGQYEALRDADSVGGHFHLNIKKSFDAVKLGSVDLDLSS